VCPLSHVVGLVIWASTAQMVMAAQVLRSLAQAARRMGRRTRHSRQVPKTNGKWRLFRRPTGVVQADFADVFQHHDHIDDGDSDSDSDSDDDDGDDVLRHHNGNRPAIAPRVNCLVDWPSMTTVLSISDLSSSSLGELQEEDECLQATFSHVQELVILDDLHGCQIQQYPLTQTNLEVHDEITRFDYSHNLLPGFNDGRAS